MNVVKDFRCNGCGAPLPIPKNSKGHVKCPSCKTESVIEGLVKNAEMAAKENIASGIPLTASPAVLHRKLVSNITETPSMPLDVFEKGVVVGEEHHCVPAFYFYCNGTASYTYEAGTEKEKDGDSRQEQTWDGRLVTKTKIIRYIEWSPMNGTANASGEVVASGNKEFGTKIRDLYMHLDQGKLYDYDELEFPPDVITHNFNSPQTTSFNEYAKSYFEELLKANAEKALSNKTTKDLTMGGSRIDKDEVVRIFLGLYRIVFKYREKEYAIWVTGDGEKAISEGMPEDTQYQSILDAKKQSIEKEVSSIPVPKDVYTLGIGGSIIGGIALAVVAHPIFFAFGLAGSLVCMVLHSKIMKPYNVKCAEVRAKCEKEIDDFTGQASKVVQQFKANKQGLRGIYAEEVTGDDNAF